MDPCRCGGECCEDAKCKLIKAGKGSKKVNRICPENPPLCCRERNCGECENCSKTYCISGRTLNKIWRDISGLPCDKYNSCFEYNLTDSDFEELYTAAKRERKIMRLGLEEGTRCPKFEQEPEEKAKERHAGWGEKDRMGETYGCSRGECDKGEQWTMMFHQPRHFDLGMGAPMGTGKGVVGVGGDQGGVGGVFLENVIGDEELINKSVIVVKGDDRVTNGGKSVPSENGIIITEEKEMQKNNVSMVGRKLIDVESKVMSNGDGVKRVQEEKGEDPMKKKGDEKKVEGDENFKLPQKEEESNSIKGGAFVYDQNLNSHSKSIIEDNESKMAEFEIEDNTQLAMDEIENYINEGSPVRDSTPGLRDELLTATELTLVENQKSSEQLKGMQKGRIINSTDESVTVEMKEDMIRSATLPETFVCPSPIKLATSTTTDEVMMVEVLDLSTTNKRRVNDVVMDSGVAPPDQTVLRNLPPVPLSYIIKEVPSVEKVLGMIKEVKEREDKDLLLDSGCGTDLSNPYWRILYQEIPYLIQEDGKGEEEEMCGHLENTVIDRLEQLRVYQLNLKRAHMGIGELIFKGPHYPHVQRIQDLIEYPLTEEEYCKESGDKGQKSNPGVGPWSPPYQDQRKEQEGSPGEVEDNNEDSSYSGEQMQRRYGAIQSPENARDRSYEEEEGDYFDEEDEFLDYYSDMQYLKQSEQQILAIFTDHIMNSMLDEVLGVVQKLLPRMDE